jgi:hypothetical protein
MQPFLLSSDKRTGSHYLQTALEAHPAIRCRGEFYSPRNQDKVGPNWFQELYYTAAQAKELGIEADGLLLQRSDGGREGKFKGMRGLMRTAHPNLKVLMLYRENVFAQFVSKEVAKRRKQWCYFQHQKGKTDPDQSVTVTVDPAFMLRAIGRTWQLWQRDRKEWQAFPQLVLKYEDAVADLPGQTTRIFEFLGVRPVPVQSRALLQVQKPLSEVVTNYAEAVNALHGTRWAGLIERYGL